MHELEHPTAHDRMLDLGWILEARDLRAPSVIYREIAEGLFIEPIKLSLRCSRWLLSEVSALNTARTAGWSADEIRQLVIELRGKRKAAGDSLRASNEVVTERRTGERRAVVKNGEVEVTA